MLVLEIAAQGVRGVVPPGGRATLRPGYNVLAADGVAAVRLIEALLWPATVGTETVPRGGSGPSGASGRIGITLLGSDNITYRLVRELTGGIQLHRFDPERRSFTLVSQSPVDIGRHLGSSGGVPAYSRFKALLSIQAAELPSRQAATGLRGPVAAAAPSHRPLDPKERGRKLAQLKAELEKAKVAEKQQYRLDGLQSKLFKLEEALQSGPKIRQGLEAAEAALQELAPVVAVVEQLGDPDAQLAVFAKAKEKLEEGLARIETESSALGDEMAPSPSPFWKDPRFLAVTGLGAVLALLGTVAGALGETTFRYLALLDIPAFAYAGYLAWRWIDQLEEHQRSGRRRRRFDEWKHKLQEQYDRETSQVRGAMAKLGVSAFPDLKELLGRLADAQQVAAEWHRRQAEWEAKAETRDAASEKERVEAEIKEAENLLSAEAGGYVRDPRTIETEIEAIEAEAAAPAPAPVAAPAARTPPAAAGGDTLKALIESAAGELKVSAAAAIGQVSRRLSEVLPAISAQRFKGLFCDDRGNLLAQGTSRTSPVATLPPADRDLCFLALKLGLLDYAFSSGKAMAFVDEAFAGLPEVSRRSIARLLKQLARAGQILHVTTDPVFREAADHAAKAL